MRYPIALAVASVISGCADKQEKGCEVRTDLGVARIRFSPEPSITVTCNDGRALKPIYFLTEATSCPTEKSVIEDIKMELIDRKCSVDSPR